MSVMLNYYWQFQRIFFISNTVSSFSLATRNIAICTSKSDHSRSQFLAPGSNLT